MRRSIPLICGVALSFLLAGTSPMSAQQNQSPTISAAASDQALTTLFVSGSGFASNAQVYLSGVQLGGILIGNVGTTITASIPNGVSPGSYRLTVVQTAGNKTQSASFDITLVGPGIAGPTGPQGPAGATGPAGQMGPEGPTGPIGPQGPQGVQGVQGVQGANGFDGPVGPTGPAGMNGAMGLQGPVGPTGPQGTGGISSAAFTSGYGADVTAAIAFIGPTLSVSVGANERVFINASRALGSSVGANNLGLYVCYKASAGSVTTVGGGSLNLSAAANTRQLYALSGITPNLAADTYQVGLCGYSSNFVNWNSNEYGYVTAFVIQ